MHPNFIVPQHEAKPGETFDFVQVRVSYPTADDRCANGQLPKSILDGLREAISNKSAVCRIYFTIGRDDVLLSGSHALNFITRELHAGQDSVAWRWVYLDSHLNCGSFPAVSDMH